MQCYLSWLHKVGLVLIFCCAMAVSSYADNVKTPAPVSGRSASNTQQIIPADVLARVKLLQANLNLIRKALGKPQEHQDILTVYNAAPREVYFEAEALFQKANRLAFEVTGSTKKLPEHDKASLTPSHVWQLVDAALKRILLVKQRLGITEVVSEKITPSKTTPTDVFNALLQANQELNAMLYSRVTPSDVYAQVTLAINYTADIMRYLKLSPYVPDAPAFQANRRPSDVYGRLLDSISILQKIAEKSGIKMLGVRIHEQGVYQVSPSNVFDLSKIIVAEVLYISHQLPDANSYHTFYPGYKTPSDVYQRTGILMAQLNAILAAVDKDPNWLKAQQGK